MAMSQRSHSKSDREDYNGQDWFRGWKQSWFTSQSLFRTIEETVFWQRYFGFWGGRGSYHFFCRDLLTPEFCPRKESSETIHRPRSTLDALNPTEDKNSASLPQSLLIKDVVNVFQSLIDKKVHLEPAGLGSSVGCSVRLETRRSRVQPPPRSATFFHGDWSWNIFYGHSLPSADSRRAVVSFSRKNVHNTG